MVDALNTTHLTQMIIYSPGLKNQLGHVRNTSQLYFEVVHVRSDEDLTLILL